MAKKRAATREGMVVTTIALDKELHEALERVSFEDKVALTELVRQAVRAWLAGRRKVRKR
jgi:metal-responsive CopG/Arc/MetJ family transcriptional regulator